MFWNEYKNMVHGSLVKRIPKGYLYKYTIVFNCTTILFQVWNIWPWSIPTSNIAFETLQNGA